MLGEFYQKNILEKPKAVLLLLAFFLLIFGYFSKDFRLDASSDTLLIDGDPDLQYLKEINKRYNSKEFLVLTFTPKESMISENSINNLLSLKYKIQSLDWIDSVITILDVPLLTSTDDTLTEKLKNFSTLKSEGINKNKGFNEILNSPVFKNFVISEDGNTTGIIAYLKKKSEPVELSNKELEIYKDKIKKENHENIIEIREVIKPVGLSPMKSKGIHGLSKILIEKYEGKVPQDFLALESLPAVGHKTASVVMSQAFGVPSFPVDTHIHRLMYRWGLSSGKNVVQTEKDAKRLFPKDLWNKLHLQIIFYGRERSPARGWNIKNDPITLKIGRKSITKKLLNP